MYAKKMYALKTPQQTRTKKKPNKNRIVCKEKMSERNKHSNEKDNPIATMLVKPKIFTFGSFS